MQYPEDVLIGGSPQGGTGIGVASGRGINVESDASIGAVVEGTSDNTTRRRNSAGAAHSKSQALRVGLRTIV